MTRAKDPQNRAANSESLRGSDSEALSHKSSDFVPPSSPQEVETKVGPSSARLSETEAAVAWLVVVVLFVFAGSLVSVPGSSEPQVTGAAVGGLIGLALVILSWTWRR